MATSIGTTISGVAERVNDRGIKLNGEWRNVSKFHPVELPPEGSQIVAVVDAKGFLSSITVLDSAPIPTVVSRNETITRLAVLKAAADFMGQLGQAREQIKADHVLAVADKWLEWVEQP